MPHAGCHCSANSEHWDIKHIPHIERDLVGADSDITKRRNHEGNHRKYTSFHEHGGSDRCAQHQNLFDGGGVGCNRLPGRKVLLYRWFGQDVDADYDGRQPHRNGGRDTTALRTHRRDITKAKDEHVIEWNIGDEPNDRSDCEWRGNSHTLRVVSQRHKNPDRGEAKRYHADIFAGFFCCCLIDPDVMQADIAEITDRCHDTTQQH